MDLARLQAWIGREENRQDVAAEGPCRRLAALLDHDAPPWRPGEVPPLGHWLSFLPDAPQGQLDVDGHPRRGGFLPPIDLPRRMWAGGRLSFHAPIALGSKISRRSVIVDVKGKAGSSGPMVFVTLRHEISAAGSVAIVEEQDLVYRGLASGPAAASPADPPRSFDRARAVTPDPVMLFRYSALTFNGHRIHYDRDYACDVEGYPGLVVHGPLVATLLLDHFLRGSPGAEVSAFSFRAQRPLFDLAPFELCLAQIAAGADLWALSPQGAVAMSATVAVR